MTVGVGAAARDGSDRSVFRPWHAAVLTSLAISHPLATVLVRGPEFFIAYRADRFDLVALGIGLFVLVPGAAWLAAAGVTRLHPAAGRAFTLILVGAFSTLIAWQALQRTGLSDERILALGAIAGAAFAVAYGWLPLARVFVTALSPVLVAAPLLFFASGPVLKLMDTSDEAVVMAAGDVSTPIVFIVFDQLPLVSLLDRTGTIDAKRFPAFAALAERGVWYRNTAAVSDRTNWALPAILTGRYPKANTLPFTADHPGNLFTLLGASHVFHVREPLTALCPPQLCPAAEQAVGRWLGLASDLAIVYGHLALPEAARASLPPVTQNWRGFGRDFWQGRWAARRDTDRRQGPADWIETLDMRRRPFLAFLHVLLPHEPFVYLPTGQLMTPLNTVQGLERRETWTDDPRIVAEQYQRHLLQLGYVDRLLARVLERLEEAGVYDDAAIVVTADHGASFRPGRPFKSPTPGTMADVAAVPFLFKPPGRRDARVVDTPLETIDVLPTVMRALGVELPWTVDGRPEEVRAAAPGTRRIYFGAPGHHLRLDNDAFEDSLRTALAWKAETIDDDAARLDWRADPARHLVGTTVASLRLEGRARALVTVNDSSAFNRLDPAGTLVPVHVSGSVLRLDREDAGGVRLAVAVNGVIRATTEARRAGASWTGAWRVLVPLEAYRPGRNDLEFFEVPSPEPGAPLRPVLMQALGQPPNLIEPGTQHRLGITAQGFHGLEWVGVTPFQWTGERATLVVPLDPAEPAPTAVGLEIQRGIAPRGIFRLEVNGCRVFEGPQPASPWTATLSLAECGVLGDELTLVLTAEPAASPRGESRTLGLAVEAIRLIQD